MQSDTIIGIVGAAVLVAVMVGVFAFEYNNAPGDADGGNGGGNGMTDAQKKAAFNETYPVLAYDDDIDGDGIPNWNDTDIDGDGIPNEEDNRTEPTFTVQDDVPAAPGDSSSKSWDFPTGRGNQQTRVWVNYTVALGPTGDPINDLSISLTDQNGEPVGSCQKTFSDGDPTDLQREASCMFDLTAPLAQGTTTLTVTDEQALEERSFSATAMVWYDA